MFFRKANQCDSCIVCIGRSIPGFYTIMVYIYFIYLPSLCSPSPRTLTTLLRTLAYQCFQKPILHECNPILHTSSTVIRNPQLCTLLYMYTSICTMCMNVCMCTITTLQRALPKHGTRNAELVRRSA